MLDKAILHRKEHREPYRRSKAIDRTCRNHGSCSYCQDNRLWKWRDKSYTEREIISESAQKPMAHATGF